MRNAAVGANFPSDDATPDHARLSGVRLLAARMAWALTVALVVGLQAFSIPFAYAQMLRVYPADHACPDTRYTAAQMAALHAAGISSQLFATWIVVNQCLFLLFCVGVATLIVWRRSNEWLAIFSAITLVLFAVFGDNHQLGSACALRPHYPALAGLLSLLTQLSSICLPIFFYLFPSGRWTPRWIRWLTPLWLLVAVLSVSSANLFYNHVSVGNVVEPILLATCIAAQVYRYRHVSNPAEQRQTKWVVLGIALGLGGFAIILAWGAFNGNYDPTSTRWPVDDFISAPIINVLLSALPISIGIAILRSRLFDIDLLINRVLVYGSATGLLAALYLVSVIGLQALAQRMTGQTSTLALVISTLAIAALFQPLRRTLQRGIDRRFYRRRYSATRTVAKFSAIMRNEVNLSRLREDLLTIVDDTMRPEHISLWLRHPERTHEAESLATSEQAPEG